MAIQETVDKQRPLCGQCCGQCTCIAELEAPKEHLGPLGLLREDVQTIFNKDPAARSLLEVLTCYPGLHAIWLYRLAHGFWARKLYFLGRLVSHICRWLTGIEIHPGAQIGRRVFIDHGMGVVIGETAEVGDDVLMYKGVLLGGVALEKTKRHPTICNGVVLGSDAIILGPIEVGTGAKIGSGSVVVKPVPPHATVVGVPGKVIKINDASCPRQPDLHHERIPDVVTETLNELKQRIEYLETRLEEMSQHASSEESILEDGNRAESSMETEGTTQPTSA